MANVVQRMKQAKRGGNNNENSSNASNTTTGPNSNANCRTHSRHASNVLSANGKRSTMISQALAPMSRYSGAKPSVKASLHLANINECGENEHEHGETIILTDSEHEFSTDEDDEHQRARKLTHGHSNTITPFQRGYSTLNTDDSSGLDAVLADETWQYYAFRNLSSVQLRECLKIRIIQILQDGDTWYIYLTLFVI